MLKSEGAMGIKDLDQPWILGLMELYSLMASNRLKNAIFLINVCV